MNIRTVSNHNLGSMKKTTRSAAAGGLLGSSQSALGTTKHSSGGGGSFSVSRCSDPTPRSTTPAPLSSSSSSSDHTDITAYSNRRRSSSTQPAAAAATAATKIPRNKEEPIDTSSSTDHEVLLLTSRRQVNSSREERQLKHIQEAAKATSMVPLSRKDQMFALLMLLTEAWRYSTQPRVKPQRKLHGAPLSKRNSAVQSPGKLTAPVGKELEDLRATFECLQKDITLLMTSLEWLPNPEPNSEQHPYLFTLNQLGKQGFFNERSKKK